MSDNYNLGKGWHLDKRFTVGHVLTTLVVGASAFAYVATIEKRVTLLEARASQQDLRFERLTTSLNRQFDRLEGHLIRIENKLDTKRDK